MRTPEYGSGPLMLVGANLERKMLGCRLSVAVSFLFLAALGVSESESGAAME